MRLRLFIPLLVTACLRENGAFDGDTASASAGASTTVAPTSTGDPGGTSAGTTSNGGMTGTTGTTGSSTSASGTTTGTTGDPSDTATNTTTDTTTGESVDKPTLCDVLPDSWTISAPKKLGMPVNLAKGDLDMWLSEPGMVLMWSSYREDKVDTYRATRMSFGADFDQAFNNNQDIGLSTPGEDTKIALSKNEERAYLAALMPGDEGHKLYMGDRKNGSYGPLSPVPLDFPGYPNVVDPHISTDDLRLYYAASKAGDQKLVVATRPGTDLPFGAPSAAPFVNVDEPGRIESDPTLPAHELVLLYVRAGELAEGGNEIYYAVRASKSEPFGAPQKFPVVNSNFHDMSPHLSRDGCELFFIRGTEDDPYDWDIYRSEIQ